MGSLNKLPPEVVRELRRHISPTPLKRMTNATTTSDPKAAAQLLRGQQKTNQRPGSGWVLAGTVVFTAGAAHYWIGNLNARDEPLTKAQIRRGAFNNSGSTDAGKDPQWDFRKGQYKKDDNYWAIFDGDKNEKIFGAGIAAIGGTSAQKKKEENDAALAKIEAATKTR